MKKVLIFILFSVTLLGYINSQTSITSSAMSATLKTEMVLDGKYSGITPGDAFYYAGTLGVYLSDTQNGAIRVMLNNNTFTGIISASDGGLVKAWSKDELASWLAQNYQTPEYTETLQGANWTISFKVQGNPTLFTGTSNNNATALATAILALLAI